MNSYSDQTITMRMDMTYSQIFNKELLKKIADKIFFYLEIAEKIFFYLEKNPPTSSPFKTFPKTKRKLKRKSLACVSPCLSQPSRE